MTDFTGVRNGGAEKLSNLQKVTQLDTSELSLKYEFVQQQSPTGFLPFLTILYFYTQNSFYHFSSFKKAFIVFNFISRTCSL